MKGRQLNITFISSTDSFFSIYKIAKSTAAEHYIFFNQKDQVHPNSYAGYLALKAQYLHLENKTKINIETHTKYLRHLKRFETIGDCAYCKKELQKKEITVDHFIPRVHGGKDSFHNFKLSCIDCNRMKGSIHPIKQPELYALFLKMAKKRQFMSAPVLASLYLKNFSMKKLIEIIIYNRGDIPHEWREYCYSHPKLSQYIVNFHPVWGNVKRKIEFSLKIPITE